ncbi:MAG TPA: RNA methyltransferase [Terriglobia bacterium]|nr:RNA methyltransferase [Terriglobia bacterium]
MREITSPTNPLIKVFRRSLEEGVTREGWLAVEGPLLVREALRAASRNGARGGCTCVVHSILTSRGSAAKFADLLADLPVETEVASVPDTIFERVTATVTPQGIAALVEVQAPRLEAVLSIENVRLVVAFGLQDPGNLGTIVRSSEALGADALITLKPTVSPSNPKILRASGGALFWLPVFASLDAERTFAQLRDARAQVVAADSHSANSIADADLRGPVAFLIGNEAAGLPAAISPDATLAIPLRPGVDSLNAAVAAGIFLYEAARQRGFHR